MAGMNMSGMDVDDVRAIARVLDAKADDIENTLGRVGRELADVEWVGRDRNRFVDNWEGSHAVQLRGVVAGLREAASGARADAADQERKSRISGGGGSGGGW